jgi:hemerythrin-like domain-containing protein
MTDEVARVLKELRQDHRNMALMLKTLEREANRAYAGEDPDFELLHDIMHYMTIYPDVVHHPKEDRIYAELKTVRPDLTAGFSRISMDHRNIAELGIKLRDDIAEASAGSVVKRNDLIAAALRYVNTLRSHMQWEELDLFHRIEEMIAEGHNLISAADMPHRIDPVFGPEVEHMFGRLLESMDLSRPAP